MLRSQFRLTANSYHTFYIFVNQNVRGVKYGHHITYVHNTSHFTRHISQMILFRKLKDMGVQSSHHITHYTDMGLTWILHGCCSGVTGLMQRCNMFVIDYFKGCYRDVTQIFFRVVKALLHGGVIWVLEVCFRGFTQILQHFTGERKGC